MSNHHSALILRLITLGALLLFFAACNNPVVRLGSDIAASSDLSNTDLANPQSTEPGDTYAVDSEIGFNRGSEDDSDGDSDSDRDHSGWDSDISHGEFDSDTTHGFFDTLLPDSEMFMDSDESDIDSDADHTGVRAWPFRGPKE